MRDQDSSRSPTRQRETGLETGAESHLLLHLPPRRNFPTFPRKLKKMMRTTTMRTSRPGAACTLPCGRPATRPAGRPGCKTSAAGTRNTFATIGRWRGRHKRRTPPSWCAVRRHNPQIDHTLTMIESVPRGFLVITFTCSSSCSCVFSCIYIIITAKPRGYCSCVAGRG